MHISSSPPSVHTRVPLRDHNNHVFVNRWLMTRWNFIQGCPVFWSYYDDQVKTKAHRWYRVSQTSIAGEGGGWLGGGRKSRSHREEVTVEVKQTHIAAISEDKCWELSCWLFSGELTALRFTQVTYGTFPPPGFLFNYLKFNILPLNRL